MRAATIFGPGNLSKYLERFQRVGKAEWSEGMPASSSDADVVVIFGGDGTIHRHLPQLVALGLPALAVPCGSGNDFARALKLRSVSDSLAAWTRFAAGEDNVRTIDLGLIREIAPGRNSKSKASDKPALSEVEGDVRPTHEPPHYFCCVAGAGIDTEIVWR